MNLEKLTWLCVIFMTAACASPVSKVKRTPTGFGISLEHFAGSILTTAHSQSIDSKAVEQAARLEVEVHTIDKFPQDRFQELSVWARLVVDSEQSWQPAPRLLTGARIAWSEDPSSLLKSFTSEIGKLQSFRRITAALPINVSARLDIRREKVSSNLSKSSVERTSLLVHRRSKNSFQIALEREIPAARGKATSSSWETVVLVDRPLSKSQGVIIVPKPFAGGKESLALSFRLTTQPRFGDPGFRAFRRVLAQCRRQVTVTSKEDSKLPQTPQRFGGVEITELTIKALNQPPLRRRALVNLATKAGAPLMEEICQSASSEEIAQLATLIVNMDKSHRDDQTWAWDLEWLTFKVLRSLWITGSISPVIEGILIRFAGAVASQPSIFIEIVEDSSNCQELTARLTYKNKELLSDGAPIIRLRAHEWLAARGKAPPKYNPLDPVETRELALEEHAKEGHE